jgi:hypothetical protein
VQREQGWRRDFPLEQRQWLLFDPQLYLSGLDATKCGKTCSNLATYSWFGMKTPGYDSGEQTQRDWFEGVKAQLAWSPVVPTDFAEVQAVVSECLEYQAVCGVTHLISPSPLAADPSDGFQEQVKWLDAGLSLQKRFGKPLLGTLAISDYLLSETEPRLNEPLQGILDSVATRELDGLYVLVTQDSAPSSRMTERRLAESLLYISYIIGLLSKKIVVINFADDLGYACLSLGASAFSSGWTSKHRRLSMSDFVDRGGGLPLPRFYAHSLAGDFLSQRDLTKLRDAQLLHLIEGDVTDASQALLSALAKGASANDIPTWRETPNNISESASHRVACLKRAADTVGSAETQEQRLAGLKWLRGAETGMALVLRKLSAVPPKEDGQHISEWVSAYGNVLALAGQMEGS